MNNKKQSSIDFILNAFNLLSDSDFKAWMLNNHDKIKSMHKEEIAHAYNYVSLDETYQPIPAEHYYTKTFGGQDNE